MPAAWRRLLRRLCRWAVRTPGGYRPRPRLAVHALEDRLAPAAGDPTFRGGLTVASADITGDGRPDLVGAPGGAVAPRVVVYDGTGGDPLTSYLAFEPTFLGGVFVAVGDVTGDGKPEVVSAAGAGGGPRVVVTDPRTGRELASFFAYDVAFGGGVRVAVADLDRDGAAEIVTGPGAGGGPHVRVFDGSGKNLGRDFLAYAADFRGGLSVAAGDADGDGAADIVTAAGVGGAPHVKVFSGRTGAVVESYFAFDPAGRGGAWVAAGDVDGNGLADVAAGAGLGDSPVVRVFSHGAMFAEWDVYEPSFRGGVRTAVADLDGDAFAEIVTGPGDGGGPRLTMWDWFAFTRDHNFFAVTDGRPLGFSLAAPPPRTPLFDGRTLLAPGAAGTRLEVSADLLRRLNDTRGEVGLYPVDDAEGTVGGLRPGDPGYAAAALAAGRRRPLFAADAGPGATAAFELRAGDRLGVYLIRDGSAADWLAANPANDPAGGPVAVFPFAAANPAGADLFRAGPRNRAAFEDTAGADDDRNDAIVGFRVTGERSDLPEPPPPPPPPPANTAPTVSDLPDATVAFGVALGPVAFTVGDAETPAGDLVVTATTSDPALFPADRLVLDGSGAARTLVVTPAAGASGTATVTVTVTDAGGLTATDTFTLTVEPATQNAPPTISAVADRVIPAGGSTGPIPFTVADAETPAADLIVESATSDPVTVVLGGAGADRTVRVSPIGTWTGTATIALVVRDTGGANATETFEVVVVGPTPFGDLAGWTARRAGRVRGPARHRGGRQRPGRPPRG